MGYRKKFENILQKLKELSILYYGERLISFVIFGSVASDTHSPESDIDILIILKDPRSYYEEYMKFLENIEEILNLEPGMRLNPLFLSLQDLKPDKSLFWNTEFLILCDSEKHFQQFLEELEKFKEKKLKTYSKPMPYVKVKDG